MYLFEENIYFYVLTLLIPLGLLFIYKILWQKRARKQFASAKFLNLLAPDTSFFKTVLKFFVFALAIVSLSIALVNPKIGTKTETIKREGVDMVFAIDVSLSMLAEDEVPNRFEKAKQIIKRTVEQLGGDRIGLVAYAATAYPLLPLTSDHSSVELFLNGASVGMLSSQGTAISEAINTAKDMFLEDAPTSKVMVFITDGEDHEGNLETTFSELREKGIRVFAIGVGSTGGAPIPLKQNGVVQSYKKDNQGETVITKLNPDLLQKLVENGNGQYFAGGNTSQAVDFLLNNLNQLDKTTFESQQYSDFKAQFQWFLGIAIALLVLDVFLLERKTAWLQKLNLFNEKAEK